jgi:transposase
MPERVAHLYECQGLSTYRIATIVGLSRQVVTRVLHRAGVPVKPQGSGPQSAR